jgi:putative ABC transport system permease protein
MDMGLFNEMIDNPTLLKSQYELLGSKSKWATESNEVMLVLNQNSEMDDYQLYCLGLISRDEMKSYMANIFAEEKQQYKIAYNDIIGKEYKILLDGDYYIQVGEAYKDIRTMLKDGELTQTEYDEKYNAIVSDETKGKVIKIAGVVRLNEQTSSGQLSTGIAYLSSLTNEMISYQNGTPAVTSGAMDEVSKTPTSVSFYASSFESKEEIENFITRYNESVEEEKQIDYTDYIGLMMSSISTIISAISYILIAFVSISLIVSSIMIGIITYISVLERIKEIGILRAVGASKRDIKRVFTAETLIIGLISGVLGVLMALILTIPVNIIINALAGISGVAKLPVMGAVILIAISMILTFIAGLIPAKIASKKDTVVALRTE